jgi:uroporphyrinogen decarboxylase
MTGRERVRRCLDFDHPDRVPRDLWVLPITSQEHGAEAVEALQRRWPNDFAKPDVANEKVLALVEGDRYALGRYRDEWGCVFENIHGGVIGQVKRPILDDWSKLADLRSPVEVLDIDVEAINRACAASDKFMMSGCCARPFERMQFLRGSENLYRDLAKEPPEFHELLRRVHDLNCKEVEVWSTTGVDAISFMDDWGSQQNLLIAPAKWRRLFKPLYADYARIAHAAGKKIFMHSDGHIFAIFEDLIEVGIDAVNSQLFCMDIEEIGRRFAGRITFWGEIDRQHVLPSPDADKVNDAVRRVVEHLYRPEGGVIAQFEVGAGARIENADRIFQSWLDLTAAASPGK